MKESLFFFNGVTCEELTGVSSWVERVVQGCCSMSMMCAAQDLDAVLLKVDKGTPLDDILSPPQPVSSHVLDFSDDDGDEEEEPDQAAAHPDAPDADSADVVMALP